MKTRIWTALAIILVVFPPLFFGGWLLEALAVLVVCTSSYEFIHVLAKKETWGIVCTIVMIAWVLGLAFLPDDFSLAYWIIALIFFWSLPVFIGKVSEKFGSFDDGIRDDSWLLLYIDPDPDSKLSLPVDAGVCDLWIGYWSLLRRTLFRKA